MDKEDLIESDEGDDYDITESRNELQLNKSYIPLIGRKFEEESPLKKNANFEISKYQVDNVDEPAEI